MKYFFFLMLCFSTLLAKDDVDEYNCVPSPYITEMDKWIEGADQRLKDFEKQLKWFLEYTRSFPNEKIELTDSEVKKEWLEKFKILKKELVTLQKAFLWFRAKFADYQIAIPENPYGGFLGYSSLYMEITDWYISCFRKNFFPPDWENLYKSYAIAHKKVTSKEANVSSGTKQQKKHEQTRKVSGSNFPVLK